VLCHFGQEIQGLKNLEIPGHTGLKDPVNNVHIVVSDNYWQTRVYKFSDTKGEFAGTGTVSVSAANMKSGAGSALRVSPNPFGGKTTIKFGGRGTELMIYNVQGKALKRLDLTENGSVTWNAGTLPDGVYILKWRSGRETLTKKVFLAR